MTAKTFSDDRSDALLVDIPKGGEILGLGRSSIYNLLKAGDLKGVKVGKRHLITMASIRDYVARLSAAA